MRQFSRKTGKRLASGRRRKAFLTGAVIFTLALTVRLVFLYQSRANPSFDVPIVDSMTYDAMARSLAQGDAMSEKFFWQPFFYPFFLSVVYFFSGSSILWAKIVQVLLGSVTCVLTCRLGERIFNARTGILAGIITAFYGPLIFFESELLASGWAAFWSVALILLLLKTEAEKRLWLCFTLGLCGALGVITRPTFMPFFAAACVWLAVKWHRARVQWRLLGFGLISGLAGFLLVAVPVGLRCQRITGRFAIVPSAGGLNLHLGNNPDSCRTLTIRPGDEWDRINKLPLEYGVSPNIWARDRFFKQKVLEYATGEPLSFATGLARKTIEFVSSREIPRNVDISVLGKWSPLLRKLCWKAGGFGFPFGAVLPLVVVGLIYRRRQVRGPVWLFIILYPASIILVFVAGRYRVPMVPILCVLSAAGLLNIAGMIKMRRWDRIMITSVVVAAVVLVSTLPGPFCEEKPNYEAEFYKLVGDAMVANGREKEALAYFAESLRVDPEYVEAHQDMGRALIAQARVPEAIRHFKEALRIDPAYLRAYQDLGAALMMKGRLDQAVAHYRTALQIKSDWPEVHNNLGLALAWQGNVDEALEHYTDALRLKPDYPEAHHNLGLALYRQGNIEAAVSHYKRALQLRPDYVDAHYNLAAALERLGRVKEAVGQYQEVLRIKPENKDARLRLQQLLPASGN